MGTFLSWVGSVGFWDWQLAPGFPLPSHPHTEHTTGTLLFALPSSSFRYLSFVEPPRGCTHTHYTYPGSPPSPLSLSCGGAYPLSKWIPTHKLLAHSAQSPPFYQHFRHQVLHYIAELVGNRRSLNKHFSKNFFSILLYCVSLLHVCTSDPCGKL